MLNSQEITLNIDKATFKSYYAKQNDNNSRKIKVKLLANGVQIKPSTSEKAVFRFVKPDGKSGMNPAKIEADGSITVTLTDQVLAVSGTVYCDVSIINGNSVISSGTFSITVDAVPVSENQLASSNEFLVLKEISTTADKAIKDINKLLPDVRTATTNANNAASAAQTATTAANAAAERAENAASGAITAATAEKLGGIKAKPATDEDTQEIHITPEGFAVTRPSKGEQKSFINKTTTYRNLYDKDNAENIAVRCDSGLPVQNASAWTSQYMPVESGKSYYIGRAKGTLGQDMINASSWAFYDRDKKPVAMPVQSSMGGWNPVPKGIAYMRVSVYYTTGRAYCMVKEGTEAPLEYVSYSNGKEVNCEWTDDDIKNTILDYAKNNVEASARLDSKNIIDKSINPNKLSFVKRYNLNIVDSENYSVGKQIDGSGNEKPYEYTDCTDYLKVIPKTRYFASNVGKPLFWYDKDKKYISQSIPEPLKGILSPANAMYVRTIVATGNRNLIISEYGFFTKKERPNTILDIYSDDFTNPLKNSLLNNGMSGTLKWAKWNILNSHRYFSGNISKNDGKISYVGSNGNTHSYFAEVNSERSYTLLNSNGNSPTVYEYDEEYNFIGCKVAEKIRRVGNNWVYSYQPTPLTVHVLPCVEFISEENIMPDLLEFVEVGSAIYDFEINHDYDYVPISIPAFVKDFLVKDILENEKDTILKKLYKSEGLKWNCLGDSLTTMSWGNNMYSMVSDRLGLTARNYGIVSSTIADYQNDQTSGDPMCIRYVDMEADADIVTVMGCTNDATSRIGTFEDRNADSLYGACHILFSGLIKKYPNAQIGIILPPQNGQSNPHYVETQGGDPNMANMRRKVAAVKEVAEFYGLPVCDLFNHGGISGYLDSSINNTLQGDYLHLTTKGYQTLAPKLLNFIKDLLSNR